MDARSRTVARDVNSTRSLPVLLHGDAAFHRAGRRRGDARLSELDGYRDRRHRATSSSTTRSVHDAPEPTASPYPSDVAKIIHAPVFHVNGDDPEAAVQAARLAIGFRQRSRRTSSSISSATAGTATTARRSDLHPARDVSEDRREASPLALYRDEADRRGVLTAEEADRRVREFRELMADAQSYARDFMPRQPVFAFGGLWEGSAGRRGLERATAISAEVLQEIAAAFTRVPPASRRTRAPRA